MSALGQQTYAAQQVMSALPPIAVLPPIIAIIGSYMSAALPDCMKNCSQNVIL